MSQEPSMCRIIVYVCDDGETERPAIITGVKTATIVNLRIFSDNTEECYIPKVATSVPYSEKPSPETWHWPERK